MKIFSKKAESLIETIIAVTVVALIATGATIWIRMALFANVNTGDLSQAISLSKEGIEMVRSIRDTNGLRYANENCWNSLEGTSVSDCEGALIGDDTYYALKVDLEDILWENYLEESSDADVFSDDYRLYECSFGDYTIMLNPSYLDPLAQDCIETDFYRQIYITYDAESMTVTSTIGWFYNGYEKTFYSISNINK